MNILDLIRNDPNVSPAFKRALETHPNFGKSHMLPAEVSAELGADFRAEMRQEGREREEMDREERNA